MKLLIGWAEESLVPEKKARLGGQFYERISEYVESPISVTAMAVESGDQQLILMSADLTWLSEYYLQLAREEFSRICPEVNPEALVLAATHTHTSLMLPPSPSAMRQAITATLSTGACSAGTNQFCRSMCWITMNSDTHCAILFRRLPKAGAMPVSGL